ncbi:flavodoxin family protein [Pusillimonas sp. TS35]|uniref:NAD(P)H-dependent oxidoreductase n=1 Tax=Paracandidimonas lactea TaxID=2895524 RepID=UPI0013710F82|nr:NAD(P)H-dependent oxidoreductase [Paracandidimonas lactea]MYN13682.1 flavodoxin family protein [Pusillimonas sp. TS35]
MTTDAPLTLLIVWHSRTGAARALAHAGARGALAVAAELQAQDRLNIVLKQADQAEAGDLLTADAYLFCAPENLATLSGAMKEFFDRNYYAVLDQLNGRPYALAISAGSDGQGAARQAERICKGWRLNAVAPTLIVNTDAQTAEKILAPKTLKADELEAAATLGGTLAALLL